MTEVHENVIEESSITLIDGQVVRLEWANGSGIGGVILTRDGNVHIAFGQSLEFNLQIIENGQTTPVMQGATLMAIPPNEPTGFGAVAVNGDRQRWVRVHDGWLPEDGSQLMSQSWDEIGALAVIDYGHPAEHTHE